MIRYDFHMHSSFSGDSDTPPEQQAEEAIRLGASGICFTDHMDYDYPMAKEAGTDFEFDDAAYYAHMCELRDSYKGRLEIMIGIEYGLRSEPELIGDMNAKYTHLNETYDLDFTIGSTHCLEYTDPFYAEPYWVGKTPGEGLEKYFIAVAENAKNYDCFDSAGHFDYVVRYVPLSDAWKGPQDYDPMRFLDIIDEYLKTLIHKGKALECNTAGIKYGLGFTHPHESVLKRYRELGGELLTIGSDGHKPEHIFYDFQRTEDFLKSLGFKYYTIYRRHKPEFIRL